VVGTCEERLARTPVGRAPLLAVAVLLSLALRASTNPSPGSLTYDGTAWLQDVATLVGSALVAAAVVLRQLARGRQR
jgi:hypothetical protein